MLEFKDGDIYRWRYGKTYVDNIMASNYYAEIYWCKSCIGIVKNGCLRDTYWGLDPCDSHSTRFSQEESEELKLEYIGNFNDLVKLHQRDEKRYYDDSDIVDITHGNTFSHECYRRKDAKKSREKMFVCAANAVTELNQKFESVKRDIERAKEIRDQLQDETTDINKIWLMG